MSQSRQLAAIMFTDIVGYTVMMGKDENKTMALVRKNREIQKTLVEAHHGKWIKEMGDGAMATFSTSSDAIYCALGIQKQLQDEPDLNLRIGIHVGEIILEDADVYGDGINVASRIQTEAKPGQIVASNSVHRNIRNKKGINSTLIKEARLKNVDELIKIYNVTSDTEDGIPLIRKNSIHWKKIFIIAIALLVILLISYSYLQWNNTTQSTVISATTSDLKPKSIAVLRLKIGVVIQIWNPFAMA